MRYYTRRDRNAEVQGPFSVQELKAALSTGSLSADSLASSDLGEGIERLRRFRRYQWFSLSEIPDLAHRVAPPRAVSSPATWEQEATQGNMTAKRLVLTATGLTVGVALLLPNIPLLTLLGFLVLALVSALSASDQQAARAIHGVFFLLLIGMAAVTHSIYGGYSLIQRERSPHTWFVVLVLSGWALGMVGEYWRWRSHRRRMTSG